jgi:zinc protease
VQEGPTANELEAAVKNITGGFPLRIASNDKIVQYLSIIGFYDLPLDYLDRFTERVRAVTAEHIRDAYRRRVHPQRLAVVMVGGNADGGGVTETDAAANASAAVDGRPVVGAAAGTQFDAAASDGTAAAASAGGDGSRR